MQKELASSSSTAAVLVGGFGTTVAMWTVGYVSRLPALTLPSPLLLLLLLACLFGGGWVCGRHAAMPWKHGAGLGLVSGLLNLLILGSFLAGDRPNALAPSALGWIPGSILVSAALAAAGSAVGSRQPARRRVTDWPSAFVIVAIAATMLLLAVGGLVTSAEAGLAVTDWPRSFGYNMFLYPLSRMTGDIYYEHAHRLFGALVGLTTLVLAIFLQRVEPRRRVRNVAWVAVALVILQGVLGGLRVTGRFTTSSSPEDMAPSLALALVHGVLGQLFFATLVALGAMTSRSWRSDSPPTKRPSVRGDRILGGLVILAVVCQLVLGATQRHFEHLLIPHILFGVGCVVPLAIHFGLRSWSANVQQPLLQRLGLTLAAAVCCQLLLGFGALVATSAVKSGVLPASFDLTVATAHQWFGAVLLGLAVLLVCWSFRLVSDERPIPAPAASIPAHGGS